MPNLTKSKMCMFTLQMVGEEEKLKRICAEPAIWVSGDGLYFCDDHFPRDLDIKVMKELKIRAVR